MDKPYTEDMMTDYDLQILKEIADPGSVEGLFWGAAMAVSLEYLQGGGYVTRGQNPKLTEKGRQKLERARKQGDTND